MSAANIRAWARANGYDVPDRGVLPVAIVTLYEAAHPHIEHDPEPETVEPQTLTFEVPGTCRFEIGGVEYEVPMSIPVTWTPGGAS